MSRQVFINLPVADIPATRAFWTKLGFAFDDNYSDDNALAMIIAPGQSAAMLLQRDFFGTFHPKPVADDSAKEVLIGIGADSRDEVDRLVDAAVAAGAVEPRKAQDHGWMYGRSFDDLDGHTWEVLWMNPAGPASE